MLVDTFKHLDGPPARLGLLASNQHLQATNLLSSRMMTAAGQRRSSSAAGWQPLLLRADIHPAARLCWAAEVANAQQVWPRRS